MTLLGRCCFCNNQNDEEGNCFGCFGDVPDTWTFDIASPMGYSIPTTASTTATSTFGSRQREASFERQYGDISGVGNSTELTRFKADNDGVIDNTRCLWGFIDGVVWQANQHFGYRVDAHTNPGRERAGQTISTVDLYESGKSITGPLTSGGEGYSYDSLFPFPAISDRPTNPYGGDIVLTPTPPFPLFSGVVPWKHGSDTNPASVFAGTYSTGAGADFSANAQDRKFNIMGMEGVLSIIEVSSVKHFEFRLGWKGRFTQYWNNYLSSFPDSLALGDLDNPLFYGHAKNGDRGFEPITELTEFNDAITNEMLPTGLPLAGTRYLGSCSIKQSPYIYRKEISCSTDFSGAPVTLPLFTEPTLFSMTQHAAVGITGTPQEITITPVY
jgi:hypothetical protein